MFRTLTKTKRAAPAPATGWDKQLIVMVILPGGRDKFHGSLQKSWTKTKREKERAAAAPATRWDQTINPPARRSSDKHKATRGFSDTVVACVGTLTSLDFSGIST